MPLLNQILSSASGGATNAPTLSMATSSQVTPPQANPISQDTSSTQTPTLDPQVVALAKAIRQTESNGNFERKGASGEYGAYQWMPATWEADSEKYLGQAIPFGEATPAQQDEVAYKKIAAWKAAGYGPAQIASMWNAGGEHPDAYLGGNSGVNSKGVSYNTPNYAKKVTQAYQKFLGSLSPFPPPSSQPLTVELPASLQSIQNQAIANQPSNELFRSALATGIRNVQAIPALAKGIYETAVDPATWSLLFSNPLKFLQEGLSNPDQTSNSNILQASQTMQTPFAGANPLAAQTPEQAGGMGLEAASYLPVPGFSLLRGAAFGAGNAMENQGNLGDIAKEAALSALLFKGTDIALPLLGKGLSAVLPQGLQDAAAVGWDKIQSLLGKTGNAVNPLLDKIVPNFVSSLSKYSEANIADIEGLSSLNGKANDLLNKASSQGTSLGQVATRNGITLSDITNEGKIDTEAVADNLRKNAKDASSKMLRPALQQADAEGSVAYGQKISPLSVVSDAKNAIQNNSFITAGDKETLISNLDKEGAALKRAYPNGMSLTDLHDEKINYGTNVKRNPIGDINLGFKNQTNEALRNAFQSAVENKAPASIPVSQFNSALQKQYQLADYLDSLDGKKIPPTWGARVRNTLGKLGGLALSSHIFGSGVLADIAGYRLGGLIESTLEGLSSPIKSFYLSQLQASDPEVFAQINNYLKSTATSGLGKTPPNLK